ncbi:hypothetical protein [Aeromicrobium sp.]
MVADGLTLVDLYDRIGALERRLAEAERQLGALLSSGVRAG